MKSFGAIVLVGLGIITSNALAYAGSTQAVEMGL
jgi:hypothetical protein